MTRPADHRQTLVVGEALIDVVREHCGEQRHPGGSPANVALGLARLGASVDFHTAIGADDDGRTIANHLTASGVRITASSVQNIQTSRATATIDDATGAASYRFDLVWDVAAFPNPTGFHTVHTGSIGALLAPGARRVAEIVRAARATGAIASFDPNIRPALIPDIDAARAITAAHVAQSALVKLSTEDAEYLYPGVSTAAVLDRLIRAGVSLAVVTAGAGGVYAASGTHRVHVPTATGRVVDTIGAGDTVMAALIFRLGSAGWSGAPINAAELVRVCDFAVRAAAVTVSRVGANLPTLAEIEAVPPSR